MRQQNELGALIREEIGRDGGRMTVAKYMDLVLYDARLGYYRTRDPFGSRGDFFTAEQLEPFGEAVAAHAEQAASQLGFPNSMPVLDVGAGRGELKKFFREAGYRAFDWNTPDLPARWNGLVVANEFFDALPVHVLEKRGTEWVELFVSEKSGGLELEAGELSSRALHEYAARYGGPLGSGERMEACLALSVWMQRIGAMLERGRLLVIDYGYDAGEMIRFPLGTLTTYRRHQAGSDILACPGEHDITAHVNFTWLGDCAAQAGLAVVRAQPLRAWLLSMCEEGELSRRWERSDLRWRLQWKQLVVGMGEIFRVLELENAGAKEKSLRSLGGL